MLNLCELFKAVSFTNYVGFFFFLSRKELDITIKIVIVIMIPDKYDISLEKVVHLVFNIEQI